MAYHVTHLTGASEKGLSTERFSRLLDELSNADDEHPDVSVTHESEWCLTAYKSGFAVLENLEDGQPVHAGPLDRATMVSPMLAVAEGRIGDAQSYAWRPGYPPQPDRTRGA